MCLFIRLSRLLCSDIRNILGKFLHNFFESRNSDDNNNNNNNKNNNMKD